MAANRVPRRASFLAGVRAVAPIMLGIVPFGLVAGAAVVAAGLPPRIALGMSVVIFAGASQLAAVELIEAGAPGLVVVATVLVINLRMMMYSASLAQYMDRLGLARRFPLAYLLTDQAYALSVARFEEVDRESRDVSRPWYYLGTAAPLWVVWQICTVVGAVAGASVPESVPLGFAVPLTFLAVLVPALKGRSTGTAAVVGGCVALALTWLPFNLGLLAGATAGIAGGAVAERRWGVDDA
ncbi:AzlC family ABC transporter permease [Halomarina litorea]|uniref:AzlC family ABC transporter permease n=1 Tax=Halomarina litorea TaxID=2961595 RepID=UPI0020C20DB4|nr:AzlC family ABC transporter permease [Halomarina sp. BCD28]